jgi:hypothetical protein
MLTPISSVSVATSAIKTYGSEARTAAGHQAEESHGETTDHHAANQSQSIGLSGNSELASVNAVTATAGNRTVLQLLAFTIAAQLNVARRPNESVDAFFLRLATTIINMKDADRAALELRSGLKVLDIRLLDLAEALKAPEGAIAARIVAMAEAPRTPFARAAALAATSSYLQEGTTAQRASDTFSIEATVRSADEREGMVANDGAPKTTEGDARGLQTQLKNMFELGTSTEAADAGASALPAEADLMANEEQALPSALDFAENAVSEQEQATADPDMSAVAALEETAVEQTSIETIDNMLATFSEADSQQAALPRTADVTPETASVALETELATDTTEMGSIQPAEAMLVEADSASTTTPEETTSLTSRDTSRSASNAIRHESRLVEKGQVADHRLETLLTLKGLAEVAVVEVPQTDFIASQPDPLDPRHRLSTSGVPQSAVVNEALANIEKAVASATAAIRRHEAQQPQLPAEEDTTKAAAKGAAKAAQEKSAGQGQGNSDLHAPAKPLANSMAVPFAYAPIQPARDEFHVKPAEEERRGEEDEDGRSDADAETGDERRERLARKAEDDMLNAEPEQSETISISRDSSEADRAYQQYQRMGGF